ncbi:MAG: nucleotidyltransferase family protein [Polyangiales bacterium]|nr:nucleotidyltransferase family protein [Myxococcales bacterium]MCB9658618.1 NTP transferase domain-containing protein [Sandaracinaceae bacterium]
MNDPSDTSVPGPYTALLMAGSRGPSDPVATFCGISHKALADIAGLPMVEHVLRTLADAREVGRIIAVIEAPELIEALPTARQLTEQGRLIVTTAAPSPSRSVTKVLDEYAPYPALVTTADHPLLTTAMITDFVSRIPADVDVAALVAREDTIRAEYPETRRTYFRFADEAISGCNLFALPTPRGRNAMAFWRKLEQDRKKPWKMAYALGPWTLVRFALRRLTVDMTADAIGQLADARAALVRTRFAEAAIDVDKPDDLRLVTRIVNARRPAGRPRADSTPPR